MQVFCYFCCLNGLKHVYCSLFTGTTGAVIVPQGDDHLKVPSHELNRLKITQIDIFKFIVVSFLFLGSFEYFRKISSSF